VCEDLRQRIELLELEARFMGEHPDFADLKLQEMINEYRVESERKLNQIRARSNGSFSQEDLVDATFICLEAGRIEQAGTFAMAAYRQDMDGHDEQVAICSYYMHADTDLARGYLGDALSEYPNSSRLWRIQAEMAKENNDLEGTLAALKAAYACDSSFQRGYELAAEQLVHANYDASCKTLDQLEPSTPMEKAEKYVLYLHIAGEQDDDRAITELTHLITVDPQIRECTKLLITQYDHNEALFGDPSKEDQQ